MNIKRLEHLTDTIINDDKDIEDAIRILIERKRGLKMKILIDIDERAYNECVKVAVNDDMGILGLHLINAVARGKIIDKGGENE